MTYTLVQIFTVPEVDEALGVCQLCSKAIHPGEKIYLVFNDKRFMRSAADTENRRYLCVACMVKCSPRPLALPPLQALTGLVDAW